MGHTSFAFQEHRSISTDPVWNAAILMHPSSGIHILGCQVHFAVALTEAADHLVSWMSRIGFGFPSVNFTDCYGT